MEIGTRVAILGLIQVTADYSWSVEQCLEELLELMEQCLQDGADLVFTPEEAQYKSVGSASRAELVRTYSADYLQRCSELARRYGAYVAPWDYELGEDGSIYNSVYLYGRQGELVGRYRKVQITRGEALKGLSAGAEYPVFDLDFGKVGILTCFDNYYPESATILALRGAELILYPLYGDTMKERWEIRVKSRAIDNTVYIAPCHIHSSPKEAKVSYTGLVDPTGQMVARLTEEGSWQVVELEMGKQVITEMSGAGSGVCEDTKQYLLKMRNPEPFIAVTERPDTWPWERIRWKKTTDKIGGE